MSAEREESNRGEPATAYKLQRAHERGSIVRSADVTFAVVLLAATAVAYGIGESTLRGGSGLIAFALPLVGRDAFGAPTALSLSYAIFARGLQVIGPVIAIVWFCAVVAGAAQARGVFSAEPLRPSFDRLNPANGLKRLFSARSLHELVRSGIKIAALGAMGWVWGLSHASDFVRASSLGPAHLTHLGITLLGSLLAVLSGLYVVFALLDWSFNHWEFLRQMRMSKREVKDENKEREGDPRIKTRLRELRLELTKRARSIARVKDADVLLTNPTHYAVALQYAHGKMPAPMVTAKGAGDMALRLRQQARRHGVPVVENAQLTRAIYAEADTDQFIPEAQFSQVARILRWVYAARRASPGGARL